MNGPDHYRRAEQLIAEARKAFAPPPDLTPVTPVAPTPSELHQRAVTEALVHATCQHPSGRPGKKTTSGTRPRPRPKPKGHPSRKTRKTGIARASSR